MRKITQESIEAFLNFEKFNKQNMSVSVSENEAGERIAYLELHGNVIAKIGDNDGLYITNAGWQTNTTKERLNALPGVSIQQKNFVWYLNGKEWDGEWAKIK